MFGCRFKILIYCITVINIIQYFFTVCAVPFFIIIKPFIPVIDNRVEMAAAPRMHRREVRALLPLAELKAFAAERAASRADLPPYLKTAEFCFHAIFCLYSSVF